MAATNYNISTNYEDWAEEGKWLWGTIKDLASAAWDWIENSFKGDRYWRIEKASQAQDRIDELNKNINSWKLSQDQIASSNNEIERLTQKRDDYLSWKDANRWEWYDKLSLGLFHIDEDDIFKVTSKNADTLSNLSDKAKDNRINELKKWANSLWDFLSNVNYDVKNENAFQTYVDVTNWNREQLKDNKKWTWFWWFMQDAISDIYKQIDVKDMTITDRDWNKIFYMAEEAPNVISKMLSDDIQDALQNNYNYIKKYESYLNSWDEAKVRTANEQKMVNNYEAAIDNIERIKEWVAYMYNNYQKYNWDQGKISYAYYNDHWYSIFSTSDRTDLKLSDLNLVSDEVIKKVYWEEVYWRTPWWLLDTLDVWKFSTESLTSEDFWILATNMLAYHENVNEFKDSITWKYWANSVKHAFRSLVSLTWDWSILSNTIENLFSYATAYWQLAADMAIWAWDMILKTVEYWASKLGYGENPLWDGLTLMDLFDYEMAQQHWMLSTDLIKDQITNDESWASEILGMAAVTIDAAPDIAMQLPLIAASEAAIVRVFPENPTIFANASKYISNLTKSKNWLTMFKNYDAAMSKLNTSQFLKVKLWEFATRAIAQNYVLWAAAQWAVSEDYTDLDFFLDAAFSLFDAVSVTKAYRAWKPKLEQSFRDWFWNDYFIKNWLNIWDEDYLRMMQKDPQTVMAVWDKLRESFNKWLNAYAHNEWIDPWDAFNKYFQIYKESKTQLGYSAAMDEWNKATKNINTSILATAIKNSDSISDSIKNKIVKEVIKYTDWTEWYRYRFNEKLTKEEFDEVSRILEWESSVRDWDMVTKYTKNGKDGSVTTFTYKDEAGNSISEKEARAYDIMEAYAWQVKTWFLMNRFRQWEYDKFADKTKHMFWDVEYSWIWAKDPEAVFRERMEQFAKDYDEFDKLLREQRDEWLDARFYWKHTKKEVDQYEKVSWKKNLVNIWLEEARKIFKNLDTVSNDFYKTLCNNRFLSLYEKNEILYNVLNTEKETLYTFDKKPQKLFWSEFEKTYYIGNKRVAKKWNQYAGNVDVISKWGDKIWTMNYYINQQTWVINWNEIIYETIMIVDKEWKPFAQINMIEWTLELSDKYWAEEWLDYHFNVWDRENIQYSSRIYWVDEIWNQDINMKDRVMLRQKISNALTSNIKHWEATRWPWITSATINEWLNLLSRWAASDFQIQNWMKKTWFYQLPWYMQSIPFSYFLELKNSIAKHSLTWSEWADLLIRCCLSDIRELTWSYMVTAWTRLKDDRLKRFFMWNKWTLAVTNSLINKEWFWRTIVKYEAVEWHQWLYILKDVSWNEIWTLWINVWSKSNKSDTWKFFFEIWWEVRAMSSWEDMLIIKDAWWDLDTYTKKLTKKERQELIVSEWIDEKTEFKSILSWKYDKTTVFSDSLKVSNEHKRDVWIITALKTLTVKASMSDSHIRPAYIIQELLWTEFGNKIASKFWFWIWWDRKAHEILLKHVEEWSLSEIEWSYVRIWDWYFLSLDPEVSLGYKMNYRPEIDTLLFAVEEANMPWVYRTISIPKAWWLRHTEVDWVHYLQWRKFLVKLDPTVTEVQRNNNINLFKLDSDRARALNKATEIREAGNETVKELDNLVNDISTVAGDETAGKVKELWEQSIQETWKLPPEQETINVITETLSNTELWAYLLNRYDVKTVEDAEKLLTLYENIDTWIYKELYEKYNWGISQEEFNKYLELALDPYWDIPVELQVMQYYWVQRWDRYSMPYISYENCDVIRERIETMIELWSWNNPQKITGRVYWYMNKRVKAYKMQWVLEDIEKWVYKTQKEIETAFELASKDIPVENIQSEFSNAVTKKKKMLFTEEMTTWELDAAYDTLNRMMDLWKWIHKTLSEWISSIKWKMIKDDRAYIEEFIWLPVTMESIYELINTANSKWHSINDVLHTMWNIRNIVVWDNKVKKVKKILKADREKLFKDMANILSSDDRWLKQVFVKWDAWWKVKPPRKKKVKSSSKKVNKEVLEKNKEAAWIEETAETETKTIEEWHIDWDWVLPEKVEIEEPKWVWELENADPKVKTLDEEIEDIEDLIEEYAFDMADEEYERLKDLMLFTKDQLYNTSWTKFWIERIEKIIWILKIIDSLKVEDVTKEIKKAFDDFAKDVRDNLNSRWIIINTDTPTVHELLTNQDDWSYVFEPDRWARWTNKLTVKVRTTPIYVDWELIRRWECAITWAKDTIWYFKEVISWEHDASRYIMSKPDIEKDWWLKEWFDYVNNKPVTKDEVSEVINDLKDDVVKEWSKIEEDVVEDADEAVRKELWPKVENWTPKTARKAAFKEIKEINNKSEFKCRKWWDKKFSTIPDDKFDAWDFIEWVKNHFEWKKILPQLLDPEIINNVLSNKTLANSNYWFQIIWYYLYLWYSLPEKANKVLASMIWVYESGLKNLTNDEILYRLSKTCANTEYLRNVPYIKDWYLYLRWASKYEDLRTLYSKIAWVWWEGSIWTNANMLDEIDRYFFGKPDLMYHKYNYRLLWNNWEEYIKYLQRAYRDWVTFSWLTKNTIAKMWPMSAYEYFVYGKVNPKWMKALSENPLRLYNLKSWDTALREIHDKFFEALAWDKYKKEFIKELESMWIKAISDYFDLSPYVKAKTYSFIEDKSFEVFNVDSIDYLKKAVKKDNIILVWHDNPFELIEDLEWLRKNWYDMSYDQVKWEIKASSDPDRKVLENMNKNWTWWEWQTKNTVEWTYCNLWSKK